MHTFTEGIFMEFKLSVPEGLKVEKTGDTLSVSGPKGVVKKVFSHPRVSLDVAGDIRVSTGSEAKMDRAVAGTWVAHLNNMFRGAEKGFTYKLKVVFTHFPLIIKAGAGEVTVSNFMGEKGTRHAKIVGDAKVQVEKEYITVSGPNKEDVGQTSVNIEQACKKKKKDLRVFQDGVYVVSKSE